MSADPTRRGLLLSMAAAFVCTGLPVQAQTATDQVVMRLQDLGYTRISIGRTLLGRVRIVASGPPGKREIILNPSTGAILRDYLDLDDDDDRNRGSGGNNSGQGNGNDEYDDDEDYDDDDDDDDDDDHDDRDDDDSDDDGDNDGDDGDDGGDSDGDDGDNDD
ncbi:MAG: PepSY domain-containing protein [Pseudomonadota bacterium]